jgi:hemerythrin-like domain-containing protein
MRRSDELTPLSRHHHVALERALELRRAEPATAAAAVERLLAFLERDGEAHFTDEETVLGPLLTDDERARLLRDHHSMRLQAAALRADGPAVSAEAARSFGELLHAHVRWEERELFSALEARLTPEALAAVGSVLHAHGEGAA